MIHGGLRYLENGEFKLVRESLRERDALLRNAPHMVRAAADDGADLRHASPASLTAPSGILGLTRRPSRRGALAIKIGLTLYDLPHARPRALMPTAPFRGRARDAAAHGPALNPAIRFSATYYDAWISHPERLGIELLLRRTRRPAPRALRAQPCRGRAATARRLVLTDALTGDAAAGRRATLIVNATGAWIDVTNAALRRRRARPSR